MKVRKKPIVVTAVQFDPKSKQWPECIKPWDKEQYQPRDMSLGYIDTLEGKMDVRAGDWIITEVNGEHYPCKPDIFEKTFEPAFAPKMDGRIFDGMDTAIIIFLIILFTLGFILGAIIF